MRAIPSDLDPPVDSTGGRQRDGIVEGLDRHPSRPGFEPKHASNEASEDRSQTSAPNAKQIHVTGPRRHILHAAFNLRRRR